ncbi:hypothetical protein CYLTODRAFT_451745 [Cylindrobasidium torrendii FP15055 ss-10]|uniref:C2H2-type domain-containing protein n=1 Tax=Cylindrobasidium torrendii FP15055 ss-10 TaxID=1314674 RepID=A0A0D7BJ02_9AGAR|nr:hypothetical protein CYLTODRAFT_451745 [Cylindrobasidium torrendii FP15055 ss-10]
MAGTSVFYCTNIYCRKPFGTHDSMVRHMAHTPACSAWDEQVTSAVAARQLRSRILPGSARDLDADVWNDEADDEEYVGNPDGPPNATPGPSSPVASRWRTTIEDVSDDDEEEEDNSSRGEPMAGQSGDDDFEADDADEHPIPTHEFMRELLELEEELFTIDEPDVELGEAGPGPSTLRHRLAQRIGTRPRCLDDTDADDDAEETIVYHPTAATKISIASSIRERWRSIFGDAAVPSTSNEELMDGTGRPDIANVNIYHPFASKLDWEIARWMVSDGIGHSSFNRLLNIDGVKERLGLTYENTAGLHQTLDGIPRRAGEWLTKELSFPDRPDDTFILRHRNILEAIQSLWGDPSLANKIVYRPSKIFTDRNKTHRINMLPIGHTLASVIISTDKTQLTQLSGSRQAYPVYLTLGNIPSALRRKPSEQACILIAYLPVEKISKDISSASARYQRLFHAAMTELFKPLVVAGKEGVKMATGNGEIHTVHPILAAYVADYPEQCLVTCSKQGSCPKCHTDLHESDNFPPAQSRRQADTLKTMRDIAATTSSKTKYFKTCMKANVNGNVTEPFWKDLPFTDIHLAQTPDVLHQLYQGVLKHIIDWCQQLMTKEELDLRIRRLPRALGLRHFKNGISALSQISGSERKNMGKILLACIVDRLPKQAVTAVRAILDFIHLAQYRTHDEETLGYMDAALKRWRANKDYFIKVKVRKHFHIPKFHSLVHYVKMIRLFGTTENFNTEMFERLHIEFAKKGWRASNHRDEFPQMCTWVTRLESVHCFSRYLEWVHTNIVKPPTDDASNPKPPPTSAPASANADDQPVPIAQPDSSRRPFQELLLPKNPTLPRRFVSVVAVEHHLPSLRSQLRDYINDLELQHTFVANRYSSIPFDRIDVFHSFKFSREGLDDETRENDWVKASPLDGGRYDTVIVLDGDDAEVTGLQGTRIGRVCLVFRLPETVKIHDVLVPYPAYWPRLPLAYVKWYTKPKLARGAADTHNLPYVAKELDKNGKQLFSIIPLSNIRQSCMLVPDFRKTPKATGDHDPVPVGAIVGVSVGGVVILCLLVILLRHFKSKRCKTPRWEDQTSAAMVALNVNTTSSSNPSTYTRDRGFQPPFRVDPYTQTSIQVQANPKSRGGPLPMAAADQRQAERQHQTMSMRTQELDASYGLETEPWAHESRDDLPPGYTPAPTRSTQAQAYGM